MSKFPYDLGELNLDAMSADELAETAANLVFLAAYATSKSKAMRLRAMGEIVDAARHEATADRYYQDIPENWRW
jgi:hypothetical protein